MDRFNLFICFFLLMVVAIITVGARLGVRRFAAAPDQMSGVVLALGLAMGALILSLYATAVLGGYNLATALANVLVAVVVLALIAAVAAMIRRCVAAPDQPLGMASSLALSAGGLALTLFAFAALGWIGFRGAKGNPPLFRWWFLPVLVWVAAAFLIALAGRRVRAPQPPAETSTPRSWWPMLPAIALLVWAAGFDLLKCFEPRFEADALWYHLTLPYQWVTEHSLRGFPGWVTDHTVQADSASAVAGYPLLVEMIYTIPVSHLLPFATRVIHLAFGLGVVAAIYGFCRTGGQPVPLALAFGAAFFLFDSVNEVAAWAHTDLARTFFLVTAAATLAAYATSRRRRDLVVAALIAGLALSTHYMALVFGNGLLTIAFVVTMLRGRTPARQIACDLAIFWIISLAVFSPWPLKNFVLYGHPFYGLAGSNFRIPSLQLAGHFFGINAGLLGVFGFIIVAWFLTERSVEVVLWGLAASIVASPLVGFALVAVWVFARGESHPGERLLALYLLAYLVVGPFEVPPILRFFLPVHAIGLMLTGRALAPLLERHRRLEIAFPLVLLTLAVATVLYQWHNHLFDSSFDFLLRSSPPESAVIWHQ